MVVVNTKVRYTPTSAARPHELWAVGSPDRRPDRAREGPELHLRIGRNRFGRCYSFCLYEIYRRCDYGVWDLSRGMLFCVSASR